MALYDPEIVPAPGNWGRYSARILRLIDDAVRLDADLLRNDRGWWLVHKHSLDHRGTRFAVEGNRLRLLPDRSHERRKPYAR